MVQVYTLYIDRDLSREEYVKFINFLSEEKRMVLSRYRNYSDAQRSLLGEILAKYGINKEFGIPPKKISFKKNEYGKPYLKDNACIHFNVSHSGRWVVCVIDDQPVGIDIEQIWPIDYKIAKQFFSYGEYEFLMKQNKEDRIKVFYDFWTAKESFIKAEGKGLSIPLNSFVIVFEHDRVSVKTDKGEKNCSIYINQLDSKHLISICVQKDPPGQFTQLVVSELYTLFMV